MDTGYSTVYGIGTYIFAAADLVLALQRGPQEQPGERPVTTRQHREQCEQREQMCYIPQKTQCLRADAVLTAKAQDNIAAQQRRSARRVTCLLQSYSIHYTPHSISTYRMATKEKNPGTAWAAVSSP